MLKLSIIIVSYNAKDFLQRCLSSLYRLNRQFSFETIVVDNDSEDGSANLVRDEFPEVRMIENSENVGFAKANNIGIKIASGEYILLLNSDTTVIGDALEKLIFFLDGNPDTAVVSAHLVYPDFSDQGAAKAFPTPINMLFGRHSLLTRLFPKNKYSTRYIVSRNHKSSDPFEVDWVSGACLMVRKKVLEQVGYLDQKFFMYWEDADLCFRIKQMGRKVFCVPEAKVIHYEGKSGQKKNRNRLIIEFNKSAYRYYRKHHIESSFELMNIVAILGLALRTIVLMGMNLIKATGGRDDGKKAIASSIDN